MVRYGASDTGCPNHVNWQINPNPAQVRHMRTSVSRQKVGVVSGESLELAEPPEDGFRQSSVEYF